MGGSIHRVELCLYIYTGQPSTVSSFTLQPLQHTTHKQYPHTAQALLFLIPMSNTMTNAAPWQSVNDKFRSELSDLCTQAREDPDPDNVSAFKCSI